MDIIAAKIVYCALENEIQKFKNILLKDVANFHKRKF